MLERLYPDVSMDVAAILDGALAGKELTVDDAERLMTAQGGEVKEIIKFVLLGTSIKVFN